MKHEHDYEGIMISCPKCDWIPNPELFYKLSLDFNKRTVTLPKIQCQRFNCKHSSNIINWITFYVDF